MYDDAYIVALDQGTSSCRAILYNSTGDQLSISQQEFKQHYPAPGWVEHDPEEIWQVQFSVFEQLIKKANITSDKIVAIGITNQRETTVVWDKNTGKPIYNAIVWQDKRTATYCKELKSRGLEDYTRKNMGLPIDPYFSATKLRWILDQSDQKALLFGTIDSWLIYKMTGGKVHKTDFTNASRTLLYNIKTQDWDDYMLDQLNIDRSILPEVQDSASHFGYFHYEGHDIPILGVAGDQQAALIGQACFQKGMAKNTYGTGCFMLMHVGEEFVQSSHGLLTTLCCTALGKPAYALEGSIFTAGSSVQWLRDGLNLIKDSAETSAIAQSQKENHELILVPAFAGLGAPYWSMNSKGSIYGLSLNTSKAQLVKATLDATAYRTLDILSAMEKDSQQSLSVLRVDGGASQNEYLMQFQADILNTPIERPKKVEATAFGAAYLAGINLDFFKTSNPVATQSVRFTPEMPEKQRESLINKWRKAVQSTIKYSEEA